MLMNVIEKRLDEIRPYDNNPRNNEAAVRFVANSLARFGWKQPIVIDKDGIIVAGHTRVLAAKSLGWDKAPCVIADDLTPEEVQAYRLADNKTAEIAEWDFNALELELADLEDTFDMSEFGFFDADAEEEGEAGIEEDNFEPEPPEEPKAKRGQVWQLGRHRLMCGDSTVEKDVKKLMNGEKADMVFTDPPYGMNAVSSSGVLSDRYKSDILNDSDNTVAIKAFNMSNNIFPDAKKVWWGANYYTECLPSSECWIVWDKNNGGSDQTDCELAYTNFRSVVRQFTMASEKTNRVHPTQKPCKLFAEIADKFDNEKQLKNVVDLFGGSGSTLIACEQTGRTCFMMELDPKYVDVIIYRWESLTNKKAVLLDV